MKQSFAVRILRYLKEPALWFCVLAGILTAGFIVGAVMAAAIGGLGWISYVLYAGAAVLLAYMIYIMIRFAPQAKTAIVEKAKRHRFTENLIGDYGFRTIVFAVCSFAVSVAYVILNAVLFGFGCFRVVCFDSRVLSVFKRIAVRNFVGRV